MRLLACVLLALPIMAQDANLTKRPIVLAPTLNEYVESFPTTAFATPGTVLNTSKPIKFGTTVIIMVDGLVQTPLKFVKKGEGTINITLGADQIGNDSTLVVVYKSEQ